MSASASIHDPTASLPVVLARFPTAKPPRGPALGVVETMLWPTLATKLTGPRRIGQKDGPNLVFARFKPEPSGEARRLKENVEGRTAVALDCETNKLTGEVPPAPSVVVDRLGRLGWAAVLYTSHSHTAEAPRYRIVLPLTDELPPILPAVEVIANALGLNGVLDTSKLGAASVFYLPSAPAGSSVEHHQAVHVHGAPVDAAWMQDQAGVILAKREAEQAAIRAEVMAEAERRRQAKLKAGGSAKPAENLIQAIRDRLDLAGELLKHGYEKQGDRYLYSGSETGIAGVHILTGGDGVERAYSHHSGDPLAAGNLPSWCFSKAVDVVDVVTILDFGGDQRKALHELAKRFEIGEPLQAKVPPEEPPGFADVPPPQQRNSGATVNTTEDDRPALYILRKGWQENTIPPRPWVAPGFLLRKSVTALAGPPSAGKSSIVVAWSAAHATGVEFGKFRSYNGRPLKVLSYNVEDDRDEQMRRYSAVARQMGTTPNKIMQNLVLCGPEQIGTLLRICTDGTGIINSRAMTELRSLLGDTKPDAAWFDPFVELHNAEENDNTAVREIMASFRSLAREFDLALGVLFHTRKGTATPGDPDQIRGASSIVGAARVALTVNVMTDEEATKLGVLPDNRRSFFRVDDAKKNYSRIEDAEWFERIEHRLDNGDYVVAPMPWTPPDMMVDQAMLARIATLIGKGSPHGDPWSAKLSADDRSIAHGLAGLGITTKGAQAQALKQVLASGLVNIGRYRKTGRSQAEAPQGLRTVENEPRFASWWDA